MVSGFVTSPLLQRKISSGLATVRRIALKSAIPLVAITRGILHLLLYFNNFVFVQVGLIGADAFKGYAEINQVKTKVEREVNRYVELMKRSGYNAEGICLYGIDTVEETIFIRSKS